MTIGQRNYEERLRRLIERRTAPVSLKKSLVLAEAFDRDIYTASPIYEVYNQIEQDGEAVKYAVGAMQRVDPQYTKITYQQGDRIQNQLSKAFNVSNIRCEYKYQGSVISDTHIKVYSDIDLLAITDKFVWLEPPRKPSSPYAGDPIQDLKDIRDMSVSCLTNAFPTAAVDDSGGKSICIEGGTLRRKVDVVPASWQDTNVYVSSLAERDRGVRIYDRGKQTWVNNKPFFHAHQIREKDKRVVGGLCKVIRLMKSLRYDSDGKVRMSSFDIAGIAYAMHPHQLLVAPEGQLTLLPSLKGHLDFLAASQDARDQLMVPDESRRVFCAGHTTIADLNAMRVEVDELAESVAKDLDRSLSKLSEARLDFRPQRRWMSRGA